MILDVKGGIIMKHIPKVHTSFLPTPLHKLENVSSDFPSYNIYIKRDDLTGLGCGGNKLRKLDYLVKKALDEGYTTLLTYGAPQTNHGRLTAASAARFNLKSIIVCFGEDSDILSGNLLLDHILGTDVRFLDPSILKQNKSNKTYEERVQTFNELRDNYTNEIIQEYEEQGDKVFVIQVGGHSKEGYLGYSDCAKEILDQSLEMGITFDHVFLGNGSGGTLGGFVIGSKYHNAPYKITGINVSKKHEEDIKKLIEFCNEVSDEYDMGITITNDDFTTTNEYIGLGYNIPDIDTRNTIRYLAQREGLFVDPCYTGKAFRGMVEELKNKRIPQGSNILFIHTGGIPALWSKEHMDAFNLDAKE